MVPFPPDNRIHSHIIRKSIKELYSNKVSHIYTNINVKLVIKIVLEVSHAVQIFISNYSFILQEVNLQNFIRGM